MGNSVREMADVALQDAAYLCHARNRRMEHACLKVKKLTKKIF